MYIIKVKCPHKDCGANLLDEGHKLNGAAGVKLIALNGNIEGTIFLSSLYDDYATVIPPELGVELGDILVLRCPDCGKPLPKVGACPDCGAPLAKLLLDSGSELVICSRKGCKHHGIEFSSTNELKAFIDSIKEK
jgi:hypothetical protein